MKRARLNLQAISELSTLADFSTAFAIRAAAALGIADHLEDGPRPVAELAATVQCDEHSLIRLLRALVAKTVFEEPEPGTFAQSPVSEVLRSDHPYSMRWFFRTEPDVQALLGLEKTVLDGKAAFPRQYGLSYSEWLNEHPEARSRFADSQASLDRLELMSIVRGYTWNRFSAIVQPLPRTGGLAAALLSRFKDLTATLLCAKDLYGAVGLALDDAGVRDRARTTSCDPGELTLPAGAEAYVLRRALLEADDDARGLLDAVRQAMGANSRLVVIEPMRGTDQVGFSYDMLALAAGTGRVRSAGEIDELFREAGLHASEPRGLGLITLIEAQKI